MQTSDGTIVLMGFPEPDELPPQDITRSVTLTNEQWSILAMCAESYSETYRTKHSQTIATFVTRGQLNEAQLEATRMNALLQSLDKLQAKLV
jgi:hypothetical protein